MAENLDPFRVQKHLQKTPVRTLIFINFFICIAKRPSGQQGKNNKPERKKNLPLHSHFKVLDQVRVQRAATKHDTEDYVSWVV